MIIFKLILVTAVLLKSSKAVDSFMTVEAMVGKSAELPCNTTAENPDDKLNVLVWYRNGSSTAFYSWDPHKPDAPSLSGRYRLIFADDEEGSHLQIMKVRPGDAGPYYCIAEFTSSPTVRTFVQLNIIEPPLILWVMHENGTHIATTDTGTNTSENIGPYYVGDKINIYCIVLGGNPDPSLTWWDEERELKNTSIPIYSKRWRSDFYYGPLRKEDHGKVFTCHAAANHFEDQALAISVVIDMILPPELVSVRILSGEGAETGRVQAGAALSLQCRVLGARPLPPVTWRLAGVRVDDRDQRVTKEPSQRLVISEIEVCIGAEFDESLLTCCVPAHSRVADEFLCAPGIPLTVLYPPQLSITSPQGDIINNTLSAVKGSDLVLNCSHHANPPVYKLVWFHRDDTVNPSSDDIDIQPSIELKSLTENDGGEYACAATNDAGSEYSQPVLLQVTYPPYCEDEAISEYGVGEGESLNITCNVIGSPSPKTFRWVFVNEAVNASMLKADQKHNVLENEDATITYQRPNGTTFSTIFCWGLNNVSSPHLPNGPCTFLITDQTVPRPPARCLAIKTAQDITIKCHKAHDGGLPQKFKFTVMSQKEELMFITNVSPEFIVQEPKKEDYKFIIVAYNEKGDSKAVEINKKDVVDKSTESPSAPVSVVSNIATLSLALCGGVALLALLACGLVLCARDAGARGGRGGQGGEGEPPLCAYNTEESNCETCNDSDDSSCVVRRTESFRRAVARHDARHDPRHDMRRSSSFHSARYLHDTDKCDPRHKTCRVHSLQNISRKRDLEALGDHLVMRLPPDASYSVPKPMNTFYTLPKKLRPRPKEINDEASEITQTSDGFSLPPPPDEFCTYRAGTRIRDIPTKPNSTYGTIRKKSIGKEPIREQYSNVIISPMNTVGLPTISGQPALYNYPDDHQGTQLSSGILTSFQSNSSPRESGI